MTTAVFALALGYVFLLFLVLLALFRSEIGPGFKLALAALCLGFYLWHYDALQRYLGWPGGGPLPARFELVASFTVEPDLKQDEDGGIYLWLRDLDGDSTVPRAYRLPYFKQLHRKVGDTMRRQRLGERFVGSPAKGGERRQTRIEFEAVERDTRSHKSTLE